MADIRINALATTAASTASDDFVAVDGSANGTRKLNAFSPTFGGNATVGGNLTVSGTGGIAASAGSVTATGAGTAIVRHFVATGTGLATEVGLTLDNQGTGGKKYTWWSLASSSGLGANGTLILRNETDSITPIAIAPTSGNVTLAGNLTVSGTGTSSFNKGSSGTAVSFLSGNNSNYLDISIGRATQEHYLAVAAASGNYVSGTVAGDFALNVANGANFVFGHAGSLLGTWKANGNLLIGGVIDGGQKLQVNGTASFADAVTVGGADKVLTITSTASTPGFTMRQTGGIAANRNWGIVINNSANGDFILRRSTTTSGDPTTAVLTFDSSSNATFAGDLTVSGGNVGVGGAPSAGIGVRVSGTNFAGLYQYGLLHDGELSGTTESNGLTAAGSIKASTAVTDFNAISVVKPGMGSGASIVTSRGLQITNLGVGGGITHVYGIDIQAQSGAATTNVAIRAAGKIMFTSLPTSSVGLATGELWNDSGTVKIAL